MIGFDDPEYQPIARGRADGGGASSSCTRNELADDRRAPTRATTSPAVLMHAEVDGERLTESEFDSFFMLLAVAGNETTRNLISGGMLALIAASRAARAACSPTRRSSRPRSRRCCAG